MLSKKSSAAGEIDVLALASYPVESAATRYRLMQFVAPLAGRGINLTVKPFLNSEEFAAFYRRGNALGKAAKMLKPLSKRFAESFSAKNFDLVIVQREAAMFGPPLFEWLTKARGKCPLILDLDDATYIRYVSPTYGRLGSALKFFGKTDSLIDWAETVVCGNRFIAEYAEKRGAETAIVPTIVDTDIFCPAEKRSEEIPIIGWVGTHSTFPSLESLFPVLRDLSKAYDFKLKIVGAGEEKIAVEGIKIENLKWNLAREVEDFQSLDIGLYPIETSGSANREWLLGKSGFKAIQYMSIGIPFVVTPIGVCNELGVAGETHFTASTEEQWFEKLKMLLESAHLRRQMGSEGRKHALANFTVPQQSDKIAAVFRGAIEKHSRQKI